MSRKTRTVVTLEVRLDLPRGSNVSDFQQMVIAAVKEKLLTTATKAPAETWDHTLDSLVVKLVKKETNYA